MENLCNDKNTALKVINLDNSEQVILQGNDSQGRIDDNNIRFQGFFGIVSLKNGQPDQMYLGKGKEIGFGPVSLVAENEDGSAEIRRIDENSLAVSCSQPVKFSVANVNVKEVTLLSGGISKIITAEPAGTGVTVKIPAVVGAVLKW